MRPAPCAFKKKIIIILLNVDICVSRLNAAAMGLLKKVGSETKQSSGRKNMDV